MKEQKNEAEKSEAFWKKTNEEPVTKANAKALKYADVLRLAKETIESAQQEMEERKADIEAKIQHSYAEGTINFFESFMKTLPDFDWSLFGQANVDYAARMKIQMESEAKAAVELEANENEEEATITEEAKRVEEEIEGDRNSEQTVDVIITDAD